MLTSGSIMLLALFAFNVKNVVVTADIGVEGLNSTPKIDLDVSATSAKLLDLGSLFGQYPHFAYGTGYSSHNRHYYPSSGGYYPNFGSYNPNTGSYYPNAGYYPSSGYNPSTGYYPTIGSYYPSTNILGGNRGYGGFGGNGGLGQYSGYWNPEYEGQRNRGYGYYANSGRYGMPNRNRNENYVYSMRNRVSNPYRGYD